jgi:hypothetical protein
MRGEDSPGRVSFAMRHDDVVPNHEAAVVVSLGVSFVAWIGVSEYIFVMPSRVD